MWTGAGTPAHSGKQTVAQNCLPVFCHYSTIVSKSQGANTIVSWARGRMKQGFCVSCKTSFFLFRKRGGKDEYENAKILQAVWLDHWRNGAFGRCWINSSDPFICRNEKRMPDVLYRFCRYIESIKKKGNRQNQKTCKWRLFTYQNKRERKRETSKQLYSQLCKIRKHHHP